MAFKRKEQDEMTFLSLRSLNSSYFYFCVCSENVSNLPEATEFVNDGVEF